MAKLTQLLAVAGAAWVLVACGQAQNQVQNIALPPAPVDQAAQVAEAQVAQAKASELIARQYSEQFYSPATTMEQRLAFLSPDYVEHNPIFVRFNEVNHVHGPDGFKLFLETLSRLRGGGPPVGPPPGGFKGPQPPASNYVFRVAASGELATVISQRYRPDPQRPGKFYQVFTFDTFRVVDGRLAEHWDDNLLPAKLPMFLREPASKLRFPKPKLPLYQ